MAEVRIIGNMDNTLDNTFESANRVYDKEGLSPTIPTCAGGGIQPKVIEETKCVGGLSENKWGGQFHQQDRVYKGDIALAQPANIPEGSYKYIVASRGRNPDKPSDRQKGSPMEQRLQTANTITTVQKDNLVLEQGRVQNGGDITPTITAQGGENINYVETIYRIRKLTPKECWRLMGYTDRDFEKAAEVNSNTQLYKQAGNAIVKQVLMAIFSQML